MDISVICVGVSPWFIWLLYEGILVEICLKSSAPVEPHHITRDGEQCARQEVLMVYFSSENCCVFATVKHDQFWATLFQSTLAVQILSASILQTCNCFIIQVIPGVCKWPFRRLYMLLRTEMHLENSNVSPTGTTVYYRDSTSKRFLREQTILSTSTYFCQKAGNIFIKLVVSHSWIEKFIFKPR